jgi:hypothetical protein
LASEKTSIDPDLQRVLDAWPTLPAAGRALILAIVDEESKNEART